MKNNHNYRYNFYIILLSSIIFIIMIGCNIYHTGNKSSISQKSIININQIKKDMSQLDLSNNYYPVPSIANYFKYYDINFENNYHYFGNFKFGNEVIAAHILIPYNPKGTIFLIHGYFDHSATLKNLIKDCLKREFAVAIYDLPGHGLSTGERASINDFSEYVTILNNFIIAYNDYLPKPFHLIAHSTGCAIAYEYMNHTQNIIFKKVVFMAPLIHNAYWRLSILGYHLAKPFVKTIPRKNIKNSSDPTFLDFIKNDPLQNKKISINFLNALYSWNKRIKNYNVLSKSVLIIQGTADATVDWKYNISFFKVKISDLKIKMIENAKHQLANESALLRLKIFNYLFEYIE